MPYYIVMDIIMLGIGVFCLYGWYMLVFKKDLSKVTFFLGNNQLPEKCKNKAGFIKTFSPALLIFALAFFVVGLIFTLNNFLNFFPTSDNFRLYTSPLAILFFLMVAYGKIFTVKFWK